MEPYSSNIVPNYRHGINFAVSGATAMNVTRPIPFFLPLQTDHFIRFKRNVYKSLNSKHKSGKTSYWPWVCLGVVPKKKNQNSVVLLADRTVEVVGFLSRFCICTPTVKYGIRSRICRVWAKDSPTQWSNGLVGLNIKASNRPSAKHVCPTFCNMMAGSLTVKDPSPGPF